MRENFYVEWTATAAPATQIVMATGGRTQAQFGLRQMAHFQGGFRATLRRHKRQIIRTDAR
jgi:hypothetical protein